MTNPTAILNHLQASSLLEVREWAKVLWVKSVVAGRVICRFVSKKIGATKMSLREKFDAMITVSASNLNLSNFRCGDVVEGNDGTQYFISDFFPYKNSVTLEEIDKEAYVKPEFLNGKVNV